MKKVLITGGQGDIAQAIAEQLKIIGNYEIFAPGRKELDVADYGAIENFITKIQPDILINNAGYIVPYSVSENQHASEKNSIDINLLATFWCSGVATKLNKNTVVVNIGSSAGTKPRADWSSYCAAKAGVIMATKCWADEGIRAICISPGRTQSKMRKALFPDEDQSSLLQASLFAKIVVKAINGSYQWGQNIDVNVNNINELLK